MKGSVKPKIKYPKVKCIIFNFLSLVKKIDVFSTEKSSDTRHKVAVFSALTLALNVGSWAAQG